jgi:hypothetical protein
MGHKRKYTATAYIPRVLAALSASKSPMTRRQIAAVIGTTPESIATAMLDLTKSGGIVKLPHTNAVAATYRLPIILPPHVEAAQMVRKRTWHTPKAFAYSETSPVSLPLEPWADTVPQEAVAGGHKQGGIGA